MPKSRKRGGQKAHNKRIQKQRERRERRRPPYGVSQHQVNMFKDMMMKQIQNQQEDKNS